MAQNCLADCEFIQRLLEDSQEETGPEGHEDHFQIVLLEYVGKLAEGCGAVAMNGLCPVQETIIAEGDGGIL
jgi:hypothetical protein